MARKSRSQAYSGSAFTVPIPKEFIQNLQLGLEVAFNDLQAFLAQVQAKWGVETYRLTVLAYQREMAKWHRERTVIAAQRVAEINAKALASLRSTTLPSAQFRFAANIPQLNRHMQNYVGVDAMYFSVYQDSMNEFIPTVGYELANVLSNAASIQDDGAFPERYIRPMLYLANSLQIDQKDRIGTKPYFAGLILPNLENVLGNYTEYEQAFHHKALLKAQGRKTRRGAFREFRSNILKGKVEVTSLKQQSASRRYLYWKAMSEGKTSVTMQSRVSEEGPAEFYVDPFTRKFKERVRTEKREIPIPPGAWDETITARLAVWTKMGKAPQWLLLEHGQARYKPIIKTAGFSNPPQNITGQWIKRLSVQWDAIVRKNWTARIEKFNNTPMPAEVTITPFDSPLQPNIQNIEVQNLIRVSSTQYGTSYLSYAEYMEKLNNRVNGAIQLGNKWVKLNELAFYNILKGKYIR